MRCMDELIRVQCDNVLAQENFKYKEHLMESNKIFQYHIFLTVSYGIISHFHDLYDDRPEFMKPLTFLFANEK